MTARVPALRIVYVSWMETAFKHLGSLCTATLLVGACSTAGPPDETTSPEIFLDGRFGEWAEAPLIVEDDVDARNGSGIEFTRLLGSDDPAWLFLALDVGTMVNMQAMMGTVHILVDADADKGSGSQAFGMDGVDFALDLSRMDNPQPTGHGAGFALRMIGPDGLGGYRSAYDVDVMGAPTAAASRFELRMRRSGAPDGFARLGGEIRIKLVSVSQDEEVLDETEVGSYAFQTVAGADPFVPTIQPLEAPTGAVRVAQWNVAGNSFREPANHAALLAAVAPDVIMLDEVHSDVSRDDLDAFFAMPPLAELGDWSFVLANSGGRQKTVVASRGHSIRPAESMAYMEYPPRALEYLKSRTPESFHRTLDREMDFQISATGAWVDIDGTEVLFVPLDLESGGVNGGPDDMLRDLQARTIRAYVLREIGAEGERAPTVVGGDFNLVGSPDPLAALAAGLDADETSLSKSSAVRLGEGTRATWRDARAGPFAPGRLDFTLYSDSVLEEVGGFIFATEDLTDAQLSDLGLTRGQSALPSDHLILVTDLRVR